MSSKLGSKKAGIDMRAKNLRTSLGDGVAPNSCGVVRVDHIVGGSYSRRMYALHPKVNIRSHKRHYNNTDLYDEDDCLSPVDP